MHSHLRLFPNLPDQPDAFHRGRKTMDSAAARDDLTPQQRAAIFGRESSIVLSAGAGCGKTYVLTQRFLSHLEMGEADISQIVAITFTDRAARVMRSRIRKAVLG